MIFKRNLSVIVIATLLLTFISTAIATPALGKSSRVAVISDLTGSATVKSSGGSREYDAYIDMGLAQGDYITTNANSSVKFKIKDHEDEITIGSNAVVSLTTLTDKGKGKKSKIKVLSGSVWSNVKKLSGGDDFEVETPTAVMAVRGTKVLTNVDSETGETYIAVAAGTVSAKTNNESEDASGATSGDNNKEILIAPSQQLSLDSREEVTDLETKVAIIDPKKLVGGTSSEIIEAIVKDKADIDRENAEFIAAQKEKIEKGDTTGISRGDADSSLSTNDLDALDKVAKNLNNLIGNVVNTALEEKKVDKDKIDKIIEETNKDITDPNKKLDLDKVVPLDKTAGVDQALQKAKDEELKKLEAAKKAAEEAKKAAAEAAKLKLADALKKLEEEKARIAREKEALGLNNPTPTPNPTATPTPTPTPVRTASPTPAPTPTPAPGKVVTPTINLDSATFTEQKSIIITTATANATIYYTIDGSAPTVNSSKGTSDSSTATVVIGAQGSKTYVVRAIAVKAGSITSEEVSKSYIVAIPSFPVSVITNTNGTNGSNFDLKIGVQNLSDTNQIHGVEIHVEYSNAGNVIIGPQSSTSFTTSFFDASSVTRLDNKTIDSSTNEITFAAVKPKTSLKNTEMSSLTNLATLSLKVINSPTNKPTTLTIKIIITNNDGSKNIVNIPETIVLAHGIVSAP